MRLILAICSIFFLSCNNDNRTTTIENETVGSENSSQDSTNATYKIDGCYMRILKRDTMLLHVQQNGKTVSGKMNFDNYEKDGSTGTVSGLIEDDVLKL